MTTAADEQASRDTGRPTTGSGSHAGSEPSPAGRPEIELRAPTPGDARDVHALVEASGALDRNSAYAYLLLCSHFAGTGLVAREGADLAGFVLGYRRPDAPDTAFVWQVAVARRGRGLGGRLLDAWLDRCAQAAAVRFVEATVTPSNAASKALFAAFAKRHGADWREAPGFGAELFPTQPPHEDELTIRIGPIDPGALRPRPDRIPSPTHQEKP